MDNHFKVMTLNTKGVIWYKGESNADRVELHNHLFKTLVKSWRVAWKSELPFYYVQLSSIDRMSWPEFRNDQRLMSHQIAHVGMAVSSDLGDSLNVHPIDKKPIGDRLSKLALKYTYQKNIIAEGPMPVSIVVINQYAAISFTHSKILSTANKKELIGFELLTEKGIVLKTKATIKKQEVWLEIHKGEKIKKVLYAWQPFTRANLINEAKFAGQYV